MFGRRLEDLRNGFKLPADLKFPNLTCKVSSDSGDETGGLPDFSFGM